MHSRPFKTQCSPAFAVLLLIPSLVQATCYWQNSTRAPDDPFSIATDDTACFPDQENSPCCGTGWTCLSDGVCYIEQDEKPFYYRGTCTDRNWDSQQCPGWCFAQNSETSIPLAKCDTEQDWYCCPDDPNCDCETGKFAVKLGDSQPSTVTVIGSTSWPGISSTTAAFTDQPLNTEGTTTTSSSSASITSDGSASTTSTSEDGTRTGSQAAASATSSYGLNVTATQNNNSSNVGLAAGLGAGLGAAAVIIACLAFFLIRSRRRKRATVTAGKADFGQSETSHLNGGSTPRVEPGNAYSQTQHQYYDPQKQVPATPEELPAGTVRERAELSDYGGSGGQRAHERAELSG